MKILLITVLMLIPSTCLAVPAIFFPVENHDFGPVRQGEKLEYTFLFSNGGSDDLVVSRVDTFS